MSRILVMGGSSGIGLETVKAALAEGHGVRAFARRAGRMTLEAPGFETFSGDALNRHDVGKALEGCDAVVQALGVPLHPKTVLGGTTLFSEATAVLLPAMADAGVRRLVSITGFGAGDSAERIPLWQRPAFQLVFARIYSDKGIQERQIRESGLDWTIARPGILTNGPKTGRYHVLTDPRTFRSGMIARADVADFVIGAIRDGTHLREAPVLVG